MHQSKAFTFLFFYIIMQSKSADAASVFIADKDINTKQLQAQLLLCGTDKASQVREMCVEATSQGAGIAGGGG